MSERAYPLFVPPEHLAAKPHRQWTKKEATEYFNWLTKSQSVRVASLLCYLGLEERRRDRDLLLEAGRQLAARVGFHPFSFETDNGSRALTNEGYAIAGDMGLLLAEVLIDAVGGAVAWELLRTPKSDMSYNTPVLTGFGKMHLDPVGGSIGEARGILMGVRGPGAWVKTFDAWMQKVSKDKPGQS